MAYKKKEKEKTVVVKLSLYMLVDQLFLLKGWLRDTTLSVSSHPLSNHISSSAVCADRYVNDSKRLETASRALAEGSERLDVRIGIVSDQCRKNVLGLSAEYADLSFKSSS